MGDRLFHYPFTESFALVFRFLHLPEGQRSEFGPSAAGTAKDPPKKGSSPHGALGLRRGSFLGVLRAGAVGNGIHCDFAGKGFPKGEFDFIERGIPKSSHRSGEGETPGVINHNPEISIVSGQSPQCRQDSPSDSPPPILLDEGRDILLNVVLLQSLALPPTSGGVMSQFRAAFAAGSNTQPHCSILLEAFQGNTFLGRIQSLSSNGYGSEFNNKETAGASPFRLPGQAYVHSQMVVERLFFCLSFFLGGLPFQAPTFPCTAANGHPEHPPKSPARLGGAVDGILLHVLRHVGVLDHRLVASLLYHDPSHPLSGGSKGNTLL